MAIEEASASSRKEGRKNPVPIGANIRISKTPPFTACKYKDTFKIIEQRKQNMTHFLFI